MIIFVPSRFEFYALTNPGSLEHSKLLPSSNGFCCQHPVINYLALARSKRKSIVNSTNTNMDKVDEILMRIKNLKEKAGSWKKILQGLDSIQVHDFEQKSIVNSTNANIIGANEISENRYSFDYSRKKVQKNENVNLPKIYKDQALKDLEKRSKTKKPVQSQSKEFKVRGMNFDRLNKFQEAEHGRQVQEERNQKKSEKSKIIEQESVYGVVKTPNHRVVGKDKTMNKVKRHQHESKVHSSLKVIGAGKTFLTPGKPRPATPGSGRALKEKNETFVRDMTKASRIISVDINIFNATDIASSTIKADQSRKNLPTPKSSAKKYNTLPKEKGLQSGSKIPL